MRKPLFDDEIMEDEWEEVLKKLDKFFTGKEGKSEMDRICLQFDFHRFDLQGNEELKPMCEPIISNTIINSKSRYFKLFSTVFKYSSLKWYPKIVWAKKNQYIRNQFQTGLKNIEFEVNVQLRDQAEQEDFRFLGSENEF